MTTIPTFLAGLTLAASLFFGSTAAAQATDKPKAEAPKTEAPKADPTKNEEKTVYVLMTTSMGDITIELNNEKAPISTQNFLSYVDSGHYAGTVFHRVIDGFMVQGGGYDENLEKKPTRNAIPNEADNGLKNVVGTVAMARTNDPHSATAQFFVNVKDNAFLDHKEKAGPGWGYAVFGKVTSGMDVVNQIKGVTTGSKGSFAKDAPLENVVIKSIRRA